MKVYGYYDLPILTEQRRAERLLKALDCGANAIDFELDIFDEESQERKPAFGTDEETKYAMRPRGKPAEFSNKPGAAGQQKELSEKIKSVGVEVMISCHTQIRVNKQQILIVADAMKRRGADLIKIVTMTFDSLDLVRFLDSVVELKNYVTIPFNLMNVGENVILGRLLSVTLGSSWIYCRPNNNSEHSFRGQPTIHEVKEFLGKFWRGY
jgi:3-dehydroquinate dehydratase